MHLHCHTSNYISVFSECGKHNERSPHILQSHCTVQQMRTTIRQGKFVNSSIVTELLLIVYLDK